MKTKPDEYFNNGLFEMARIGNSIIQKNTMSTEVHQQIMDELVRQCPIIKDQIDRLVCKIRNEVLMCNPQELLSFAQLQALGSMVNITSESQQIGMEYVSNGRMAEYIQSILVSCPKSECRADDEQSKRFFEISKDITDLFELIHQYYIAYGAQVIKGGAIDEDLHKELFEAQLMYHVRGKRYQFIESEYYEQLLTPHSQELESIFQISGGDIVEGIKKLQYALSQGRIDPFNELGKLFNEFLDAEEENREILIERQREKGRHLFACLFGTTLNDVCSITGWPEQFVRELSFGLGADNSFFDHPEYPGWPIIDLPIQKRPFIEIDGRFYCFDYYSFVDNFYRTIQKTVSRLDKEYNWNAVQKEASENMVAGLFQRLLPGCTVYANNYYPKGKSKKQLCENDLLVIYFGVAIIVEVKAGSFVYTAPLVDYEQHIKSYKKLIEEPDLQCKRTYDYLLANDAAVFYTESGEEKAQIDVSTLSDIYMLSVTIDNINEFASKAEKLSFLKLQCEAISLSVDDLMVYAHYFESPLKFLHFLKQRRAATKVAKLATNDELDHLGLYIKHNCYYMDFEKNSEFSLISLFGYREELDDYFGKLYHSKLKPTKPAQNLPPIIEKIIGFLDKSDLCNKVIISNYLLDFSHNAKEELSNEIEYTLMRQRETRSYIALSSAGRLPTDLRYTCFIIQPGIRAASATEQADYVMSTMLWNGDEDRTLICIEFNSFEEITKIVFQTYKKDEIPLDRTEELFSKGKERAEMRVRVYKQQHGTKIGRNEDCPCGSGKKYKKCCGR